MKKELKVSKWIAVVILVMYLALGIVIIANQKIAPETLPLMTGIIFLSVGIIKILDYFVLKDAYSKDVNDNELINGLISFTIGTIVLAYVHQTPTLFIILIGIWITYNGLMDLIFSMLQATQIEYWSVILLISIIMMPTGIYIIVASDLAMTFVGIVMIIYAFNEIIQKNILIKNIDKIKKMEY